MNFYLLALTRIHQSLPYDIYYPSSPKCFFFTQPNVISILMRLKLSWTMNLMMTNRLKWGKGKRPSQDLRWCRRPAREMQNYTADDLKMIKGKRQDLLWCRQPAHEMQKDYDLQMVTGMILKVNTFLILQ